MLCKLNDNCIFATNYEKDEENFNRYFDNNLNVCISSNRRRSIF